MTKNRPSKPPFKMQAERVDAACSLIIPVSLTHPTHVRTISK